MNEPPAIPSITAAGLRLPRGPRPGESATDPPEWAYSVVGGRIARPDIVLPPGGPSEIPAGWWASPPKPKGGLDMSRLRRVGVIAGLAFGFLLGVLPSILNGSLSRNAFRALLPVVFAGLVVALLFFGVAVSQRRRERVQYGTKAHSLLRVEAGGHDLSELAAAIDAALRAQFPLAALQPAPPACVAYWASGTASFELRLWRGSPAAPSVIELTSTLPAYQVMAAKGAVEGALYGDDAS